MNQNHAVIDTILHFSLRLDAGVAVPDLVPRLEAALGGRFAYTAHHGVALWEAYLLGMAVRLVPWRGIGLKPVYQLIGYTELPEGYTGERKFSSVDLTQAVADLLQSKGLGTWHRPTIEEIQAEASAEVSAAMEADERRED